MQNQTNKTVQNSEGREAQDVQTIRETKQGNKLQIDSLDKEMII